MSKIAKAYLQIHIAVILFGLTAILGKLIVLPEGPLVWHRMWIGSAGLILVPGVIIGIRSMPLKSVLRFAGIGAIVALHWLAFYGSIKLGDSASIALACFATTPFFTSFIEPLITKSKFKSEEIILGVFAIIGIYLIASVGKLYFWAIVVGLLAAVLAALFSSLNKRYIKDENVLSVSTLELAAGWLMIGLVLPLYPKFSFEQLFNFDSFAAIGPDGPTKVYTLFGLEIHSFWYLLVLGLLCTSLAFVLQLKALKQLNAFTTNLVINLEPVYGVLLAIWIFHENKSLNGQFYIGTALILLSVILHPWLAKKMDQNKLRTAENTGHTSRMNDKDS